MENTGCAKEQTIRGLIAECQKGEAEIEAHLEKNFNRNPQTEGKCEGMPSRPNVLDEMIDSLKGLKEAQQRTIEFIAVNISPKL